MSYMCIKHNKECDDCGECKEQPKLHCEYCDKPIYEEELYYLINNKVYCSKCIDEVFGEYA